MERLHGGNIQEFCENCGLTPGEVIDFSTNVNYRGAPSAAFLAITQNLRKISRYPDHRQKDLTSALSDYLDVPQENILAGNGSADLIFLLCRYFQPTQALIFIPTFSEYEIGVKAVRGRATFLSLDRKNNFTLPTKTSEILQQVDLVFICNPNNPTGTLFSPKEILELIEATQKGLNQDPETTMIIDEAFIEFTNSNNSLRWQALKQKNVVVLGSLTKFFAIPGLRLGYIVADSKIIRNLTLLRDPWSINCFAEVVGREVLKDRDYIATTVEENWNNREYLSDNISLLYGFKVYPSEANFILVEICNPRLNSITLQEELAKYGIMIRDCSSFRNLDGKFIRLAVRSKKDIDYLVSSIEKIISSIKKTSIQIQEVKANKGGATCD